MLMNSSVLEHKVETLDSGTGTVPEFWCGHLKKRCVHISAHKVSYSGTKSERSLSHKIDHMTAVGIGYQVEKKYQNGKGAFFVTT